MTNGQSNFPAHHNIPQGPIYIELEMNVDVMNFSYTHFQQWSTNKYVKTIYLISQHSEAYH